jgi:hypothetical protein
MIKWIDKKSQFPNITFKERLKHKSWCLKNNITIFFVPKNYDEGFLRINEKNKITDYCNEKNNLIIYKQRKLNARDPVWGKKIWELYSEYYIKYNPEWVPLKTIKENERKAKLRKHQGFKN